MPTRMRKFREKLTPEEKEKRKVKRIGVPMAVWTGASDRAREWLWRSTLQMEKAHRAGMSIAEWEKLDAAQQRIVLKDLAQQRKQELAIRRAKRDAAELKSAAKAKQKPVKGLRNLTVDLSIKTPPTGMNFICMLKQAVLAQKEIPSPVFRKMLDSVLVEFDRYYRPFIYKFLLKPLEKGGLGFESRYVKIGSTAFAYVPYRGEVSADDVFTDVWLKLFGDVSKQVRRAKTGKGESGAPALLKFDETTERFGRGAFGCYLRYIARSVYYDRLRKDLVPETDHFGKVMYRRDRHGKILTDKNGQKIPRLVPRCQLGEEDDLAVTGKVKDAIRLSETREERFQRQLQLDVACLAYVSVHEKASGSWFYRAAQELYEQAIPKDEVIMGCIGRGEIRNRGAFDVAVKRFREAMKKERARIMSVIDEAARWSVKDGKQVLGEREVLSREWQKLSDKFGERRVHEMRRRFMSAAERD